MQQIKLNYTVYKLRFLSSIHLGKREGFLESSDEIIHSDTLFSAVCNTFYLLYGSKALDELIHKFANNNPPFLLSSAFPFYKDKLYFPVLLNQIILDKKIRKIKYVEKSQFEKILKGVHLEKIFEDSKDENQAFSFTANTPRLAINRINNSPGENFFFFSEVFFPHDSGLFFMVDFKDKNFIKSFEATLKLLGHEGIGGDRTCGKGHFEIESICDIELTIPQDTDGSVLLSLYYPKEDEFNLLKEGYYEIIERKGYVYSPFAKSYRRKSIRMITEGSVIPGKVQGTIINVTPEIFKNHHVYRYGFGLSIPCKTEVKSEI